MSESRGAGVAMVSAVGIALDERAIYVADLGARAVLAIDPETGDRRVLSGQGRGLGPALVAPYDLDVEASGALVVADLGRNALLRVDPETGNRALVSDLSDARLGPTCVNAMSVCAVPYGLLMVLDRFECRVLAVDPISGTRRVFSGQDPAYAPFRSPMDMTVTPQGHLLVTDPDAKSIYRIDRDTGARSFYSSSHPDHVVGEGVGFGEPVGVNQLPDGDLIVANLSIKALLRVKPSGDRVLLSDNELGGPEIHLLMSANLGPDGLYYYVERQNDSVVRVDPATGDRALVSAADTGHRSPFLQPYDVQVTAGGDLMAIDSSYGVVRSIDHRTGKSTLAWDLNLPGAHAKPYGVICEERALYSADLNSGRVRRLDLETGEDTVISGAQDNASLQLPGGLTRMSDGRLAVVDLKDASVVAVDPTTGRQTVLSSRYVGAGVVMEKIFQVREDAWGRLLVADMGRSEIIRIDPESGDRKVVSGGEVGEGPALNRPLGLDIAADGVIFVADFGRNAVLSVDPDTGERRIVSDNVSHFGDPLTMPISVAVRGTRMLAVADLTQGAIFLVDRYTGARRIVTDDFDG
jgi:sugar lactone lactonase YvrE